MNETQSTEPNIDWVIERITNYDDESIKLNPKLAKEVIIHQIEKLRGE